MNKAVRNSLAIYSLAVANLADVLAEDTNNNGTWYGEIFLSIENTRRLILELFGDDVEILDRIADGLLHAIEKVD